MMLIKIIGLKRIETPIPIPHVSNIIPSNPKMRKVKFTSGLIKQCCGFERFVRYRTIFWGVWSG